MASGRRKIFIICTRIKSYPPFGDFSNSCSQLPQEVPVVGDDEDSSLVLLQRFNENLT